MTLQEWYPVTSDMGLINSDIEQTVSELVRWHGSIYTRSEVVTNLAEALNALPPLSAEKRRRLFVATRAGWTACFQSGIQGSDPFPAMSMLAQRLGVLAMRVCSTHPSEMWPANIWEVYAPEPLGGEPPLGYRRSIGASNDGGRWTFDESGERFAFERPEFYARRLKRERFTRALLTEYLSHFELFPFSEDFYLVSAAHPAIVLERHRESHQGSEWLTRKILSSQPQPPVREFTLDEVVEGLPWKR